MSLQHEDEGLEARLSAIERRVKRWQFVAVMLSAVVVAQVLGASVFAQRQTAAQIQTFHAPLQVVNAKNQLLLSLGEWQRPGAPAAGAALTLYVGGLAAASFVTTGDLYKDASDANQSYLNEVKTYLYDYPAGKPPVPQEVSSLALTRAGGSLVLMNRPGSGDGKATHAARITAARGTGGILILSSPEGKPGTTLKP